MNEISPNIEMNEIKSQPVENFRNIKPNNEMSFKELSEAVKTEFNKASGSDISGQDGNSNKEFLDDNGIKYREGNDLLPDVEFDRNGYTYKTDDKGRVISAEGQLQLKDHQGRNEMDVRSAVDKGEMRSDDERGHLIGDQFNASGGIENLVPMARELNHGDYLTMENKLANAVKNGDEVRLKVEPVYREDHTRPSEFRATYSINGEKEINVFKNESGAGS